MKRYLALKVVVAYPKGWTQPEVREFLKEAAKEHGRGLLNVAKAQQEGERIIDDYPVVESVYVERMVTEYAQR